MASNVLIRDYISDILKNPRLPEHKCRLDYAKYLHSINPDASVRSYLRHITSFEKTGDSDTVGSKQVESSSKNEWNESKDSAVWSYDGTDTIHTLDDALSYSKVDMSVWEVDRHVFNQWEVTMKGADKSPIKRMNVQVKVWFKKRRGHDIDFDKVLKELSKATSKATVPFTGGNGVGVVAASDFHFGAEIDDLIRSGKFNVKVLSRYLSNSADIINQKGYKEVHLALLGDFIESFTGLNHVNSWKGIGIDMFGMNAVILCYEILMQAFISKINNLKGVYVVSGNHDRVTSNNKEDQKGEAGQMIAYLIKEKLEGVNVEYHPMVITKVIDGICYLWTHGHLGFSQKETSKILFDYGKQGYYNVLMQGHKHSRAVKKTIKRMQYQWEDVHVIQLDEVDYRFVTVAPMFTGNFFSESLGFSSSAGITIVENNGNDKIHYFDYCI
jgi:predicted phosphodiesterase